METQEFLMELRQRIIKKEGKVEDEELKRAIDILREGRYTALTEGPTRKPRVSKTTKMTEEELGALFE